MKHKQMMWMSIAVLILGIVALIWNTIVTFQQPNTSNITAELALFTTGLNTALNAYLEHDRAHDNSNNDSEIKWEWDDKKW